MEALLETLMEEGFSVVAAAAQQTPREVRCMPTPGMITVVVGVRRSGKTHLLYQRINALLAQGVLREQILFINFEDDRLLPMTAKEMGALLDSFYTLYPENHSRRCYVFLDEVQNIPDWHLVVRRYFDSKLTELYLTGSSSKLLSKEINTNLRGRSLAVEIFPYSFTEYLVAHQVAVPKKPFGRASLDIMQKELLQYFAVGGFPAVQQMPKDVWRETLQSYVDTVILRDIVERYHVTNITLLKYLIMTLLKNSSAIFSVNKFYNDIKSQGYKVGKETIYQYLTYLQDAFLIFEVSAYSKSLRVNQNKPKKIYAVDTGLVMAVSTQSENLRGRLLENVVYLMLRKQKKEIYFYSTREGYEVDFLTQDPEGNRELIQVTWDMSEAETAERETRALQQAEQELGVKGRIITAREYLKSFS